MSVMLTMTEFARKHGVTRPWIHSLLLQRRIPGAKLIGKSNGNRGFWLIPANAKIMALDKRKG